jgi:hypothetical protein
MLTVTYNPFMLTVVMLSTVILSVVAHFGGMAGRLPYKLGIISWVQFNPQILDKGGSDQT